MKRLLILFILMQLFNAFALPEMKLVSGGRYLYEGTEIVQEDFYMSKTKITVGQWKEYLIEQNASLPNQFVDKMRNIVDQRDLKIEDNYPVWGVSYIEVTDFCNWLSEKNNLKKCYSKKIKNGSVIIETDYNANGYRLPTLREWYYISELWMNKNPDYYEEYNLLRGNSIFKRSYPYSVEYEKENSFGIKDPLGNIYELCNDYYLEGQNMKLLKSEKYGPSTYTPDPDQLYFKEPLTAVYIHVGGTHYDTFEKVKNNFIWEVNLLSADFLSFRVVRNK